MAAEQLAAPCWYVRWPGMHDDSGEVHYADEAEARTAAAGVREDDPLVTVDTGQFPVPCLQVSCDGDCGEPFEDDDWGSGIHFGTRGEAAVVAGSYGWIVTAGGAWCREDAPPGVKPLVTEQIPGQDALLGEDSTDADQ